MFGAYGWTLVLVMAFFLMLFEEFVSSSYVPPKNITVGGSFQSFKSGPDLMLHRDEIGSLHTAALVLAFSHINNHSDGIADDILVSTHLDMAITLGQGLQVSYPTNQFFDGASTAYLLHTYSENLAAVVTADPFEKSASSSLTMNGWGVPVVITGSSSTEFSHGSRFPMIFRMPPSDSFASYAMYDLLLNMNWKRVSLFYSADELGLDLLANFVRPSTPVLITQMRNQLDVSLNTIEILSSYSILSGLEDFTPFIDDAKQAGSRIFVLFLDSASTATLLTQGYHQGLFDDGTQVIGIDYSTIFDTQKKNFLNITDDFVWHYIPSSEDIVEIMKGYMALSADPSLYYTTSHGTDFAKEFHKQEPTISYNSTNGDPICSDFRDDSLLGTYVYRAVFMNEGCGCPPPNDAVVCTGFDSFEQFHPNGSNINPNIMYTYDAVMMLAHVIDLMIKNEVEITTETMVAWLNTNNATSSSEHTASGAIRFMTGISQEDYFDKGERYSDQLYSVLNFNEELYTLTNGKYGFKAMGIWNSSVGYRDCVSDQGTYWECSIPTFRSVESPHSPLSDMYPMKMKYLPKRYSILLVVVGSLLLAASVFLTGCLIFFWNNKKIRSAQPVMLVFIMASAYFGSIKVILAGVSKITYSYCVTDQWLSHLCFACKCIPLFLKLWRLDMICNRTNFKRVKISDGKVLGLFLIDMTIVVLLLAASAGSGSIQVGHHTTIVHNQFVRQEYCAPGNSSAGAIVEMILLLFQVCNIVLALYFTYRCRNVPPMVNETYEIAPGK